jgi:hypothetical protein
MDVPTRSNSARNATAGWAVFVGLLSVVAVPAEIAASHWAPFELLYAGWAIPAALVFGFLALRLARRARRRTERTIGRVGGRRATRLGRFLGALGLYLGITAALAIGFYEVLNYLSG